MNNIVSFISPSLQHRKKAMHHLFVLFLGHGLGHILVHFVNALGFAALLCKELGTMLNHLFHRAVLQEMSIPVAVHAIIFILTTVGIGFAFVRHDSAIFEQDSVLISKEKGRKIEHFNSLVIP